jgi:5-methylcytosine-specific restriction endonuclease McrA
VRSEAAREAARLRAAAWRKANPERSRAAVHAYYETHKEERLATQARWRDLHRPQVRAYNSAYQKAHLEEVAAKNKAWRAEHQWEQRNGKHRRRAVRTFSVTERDWLRLVARYRHCCAYCGEYVEDLEMDHVMPLSRGGHHSIGNLLPSCRRCNASKHAYFVSEWRHLRPEDDPEF